MTNPVWPTGVPQVPLLDSLQVPDLYQDPRMTEMEGGNKRLRTRPGDNIYRVTFTILMTKAQWQTLRSWIRTTLGRGSSRFTTKIWDEGFGAMIDVTAQFAAKPVQTTVWPKVSIGFDLTIYP